MGLSINPDQMAAIEAWERANPGEPLPIELLRSDAPKVTMESPTPAKSQGKPEKRSKYRNEPCEYMGMRFDSKKELERYIDLAAQERDGLIEELKHHVELPIEINGIFIAHYEADFVYIRDGIKIVEDVKSEATKRLPVYRLKKKILAAQGIDITEYI